MEANEIMLGDWVEHPKGRNRVTMIQDNDVIFTDYSDNIDGACDIDKVKGIALFKEFFEQNGFEKVSNDKEGGMLVYRCPAGFVYFFSDGTIRLEIINEEGFRNFDGDVQYVHELQQAFRLCGIKQEIIV